MNNNRKISIIGGAGHVGFPLGLIFSSKGYKVNLIDKHKENIKKINSGKPPFLEEGSNALLKKMLKLKRIKTTNKLANIKDSKYIIVCIGTPINKNLNPDLKNFLNFFRILKKYLNKDQIIIIRSSVYPGICDHVYKIIKTKNKNLSYCPERIVQGKSIKELPNISQLISGKNKKSIIESSLLFKKICKKIIKVEIIEAEIVKLFSNAYRYVHFAISNQFLMICKNLGLDFFKVREIMKDGYKRNAHIPMSGFTAGPCLLKDTMQLSSFYNHKFSLGHVAMQVNEGIPRFLIDQLKKDYNLKDSIPVPAKKGDVVMFNINTIHGSYINQTPFPRKLVRVGYRNPDNQQLEGQSFGRPGLMLKGRRNRDNGQELFSSNGPRPIREEDTFGVK